MTLDEIQLYVDSFTDVQRARIDKIKCGLLFGARIKFDEISLKRFSTRNGIYQQLLEFMQPTGIIYYLYDCGSSFEMRAYKLRVNNE